MSEKARRAFVVPRMVVAGERASARLQMLLATTFGWWWDISRLTRSK